MDATLQAAGTLVSRERLGVRFYVSPLLESCGVRHAFSTRIGGVSQGPFASLTLGSPAGVRESRERVLENWRRLQNAYGCRGTVAEVHQVHGAMVVRAGSHRAWERDPLADAIVSDDPSRPIAVRTADCCPILISTCDGRTVAAVHAGWRGVIAGIIPAAIRETGANAGDLVAAIGPCIGVDAFEVGPEVLEAFDSRFGRDSPVRVRSAGGKGHVDIAAAALLELQRAGVPKPMIDVAGLCTFERADEFFSHRRDSGITGRMAAVIQAGK